MNQDQDSPMDEQMLEEYDFSDGVRGKYAERYAEGTNVVLLAPDVAEMFPDSESANQALRSLAKIIRTREARQTAATETPRKKP